MTGVARRIAIIDGHPDPAPERLCHALAGAYAAGAERAGHAVKRIDVAGLSFTPLRTKADFETGAPEPDIAAAQTAIGWADHLVFVYPLWLGTMPALLKAFLEQTFRPGFAFAYGGRWPQKKLKGRSAHVVVTMGMPALAYRWLFLAHSLKSFERNILAFCGIGPVRDTLLGGVEQAGADTRARWLERMAGEAARLPAAPRAWATATAESAP